MIKAIIKNADIIATVAFIWGLLYAWVEVMTYLIGIM